MFDLEKYLKNELKDLKLDEIKNQLTNLEIDINKKPTKLDIMDLKNMNQGLEEALKDEGYKSDGIQQQCDKMRGDISQILKKMQFLNQEYAKIALSNMSGNQKGNDQPAIDFNKFLEVDKFTENKKEVNSKFEKIKMAIENLHQSLENVSNSLAHAATDKDLATYQGVVKNMFDELKIYVAKKYPDKIEVNKTLKLLETQIKTIYEQYNKKTEGADNWLLANKPINNYQCASCESMIKGDLDKRTEYISWNKYPNRDEKTYRMGHGFSRMLQMVNDDIMTSTGMIKEVREHNGYNSDDEKKSPKNKAVNDFYNNNSNIISTDGNNNPNNSNGNFNNSVTTGTMVKLPKVRGKIASGNMKTIDIGNSKSERTNASPYEEIEALNSAINAEKVQRPQILKIYKMNKVNTSQNGFPNLTESIQAKKGVNYNFTGYNMTPKPGDSPEKEQ